MKCEEGFEGTTDRPLDRLGADQVANFKARFKTVMRLAMKGSKDT